MLRYFLYAYLAAAVFQSTGKAEQMRLEMSFFEKTEQEGREENEGRPVIYGGPGAPLPEGARVKATLIVNAEPGEPFFTEARVGTETYSLRGVVRSARDDVYLCEVKCEYVRIYTTGPIKGGMERQAVSNTLECELAKQYVLGGGRQCIHNAGARPIIKSHGFSVLLTRQPPSPEKPSVAPMPYIGVIQGNP